MNPSVGDGERAVLLDDVIDLLRNGRGLLCSHLRVDFPQVLSALSREMPHERSGRNHSTAEPHLLHSAADAYRFVRQTTASPTWGLGLLTPPHDHTTGRTVY